MQKLDARFAVEYVHRLRFASGVFEPEDRTLVDLLEHAPDGRARVLFFVDEGLAQAQPGLIPAIEAYVQAHAADIEAAGPVQVVPGGEAVKNDPRSLLPLLQTIDAGHLCRRSYVIAVGGGAVLDAVGFVAAMAHRGVRHIRIAGTTLAQADSAMGVKNGINAFNKKNYLGAFATPWAVINDEQLLETLDLVDWVGGFSEAVKVALLKDSAFFAQIEADARAIFKRDMTRAIPVIRRSAQLHFEHITQHGDPFELTEARPLDFGHWAAHKLEAMSGYKLQHGHAVAIGMTIDLTYGKLMGWMNEAECERILDCLCDLGFTLYHPAMSAGGALLAGLDEFREHLGGVLTIPMIRTIGQTFDVNEIDRDKMREAIESLLAAKTRTTRRQMSQSVKTG